MRPSFFPRLVNGPFDDPGLFIPFIYDNRAILFDLGDLSALSAKDLLKITHVFVTHTHMDHFVGFDRLLRLFLGREKTLHIYGPKGFIKNVEGKLAGYSWNLVPHYRNRFVLEVTEVHETYLLTRQYRCRNEFAPHRDTRKNPFTGILLQEPALQVSGIVLDHQIPSLGLRIEERFHVNIKKDAVISLGLPIGSWLNAFKDALFENKDLNTTVDIRMDNGGTTIRRFRLRDLADQIALITPGQKVTYITDVIYNESESRKMIDFANASDHLFIEAGFLEKDRCIAQEKYHLTAAQAGAIAGNAHVKQYTVFHFSPRYTGLTDVLEKEAKDAYFAAAAGG